MRFSRYGKVKIDRIMPVEERFVLIQIQEIILNSNVPLKNLAPKVYKNYSTLQRELNPWDELAKLSINTLGLICKEIKDFTPFQLLMDYFQKAK